MNRREESPPASHAAGTETSKQDWPSHTKLAFPLTSFLLHSRNTWPWPSTTGKKSIYCDTEDFDRCPLFLTKVLRLTGDRLRNLIPGISPSRKGCTGLTAVSVKSVISRTAASLSCRFALIESLRRFPPSTEQLFSSENREAGNTTSPGPSCPPSHKPN